MTDVAEHTGFPEMIDGRRQDAASRRSTAACSPCATTPEHDAALAAHGIAPIDLLVVNLYPFEATVGEAARPSPTASRTSTSAARRMIRAAAKNHAAVTVVVDPTITPACWRRCAVTAAPPRLDLRKTLAAKAFARTAAYDAAIGAWFAATRWANVAPRWRSIAGTPGAGPALRREPAPAGGLLPRPASAAPGVATAVQLQGKELSYNNLNDTDAAFELVAEFDPGRGRRRHHQARQPLRRGDRRRRWPRPSRRRCAAIRVSAFGGIIALNRTLDAATAERDRRASSPRW